MLTLKKVRVVTLDLPRIIHHLPSEYGRDTAVGATSCCQVARCILMCRVSRTITQLQQHALLWVLRIQWLCPEHDLKLFTCFCVSPCRKISSDKNSEGHPVSWALHVQNGSIWYGLEDLSCIPSLLFSICKELFAYVVLTRGTTFFPRIW